MWFKETDNTQTDSTEIITAYMDGNKDQALYLSCSIMAECAVCYELYKKEGAKCSKVLPCGHTFCLQCLNRTLKHGHIKCPFCRTDLQICRGDARRLPTNKRILTQNIRLSEERRKIYTNITGVNKNIYSPLSSRETPGVDYRETEIWQLRRDNGRGAGTDEQNDDEQNHDEQTDIEQNFLYQNRYSTWLWCCCILFCIMVPLVFTLIFWVYIRCRTYFTLK